jgi:prevent-host-death family protein
MIRTITVTEARARLPALLDELYGADEIHITKHGRVIARLVPHGARRLMGLFRGIAVQNCTDEELIHNDSWRDWETERELDK